MPHHMQMYISPQRQNTIKHLVAHPSKTYVLKQAELRAVLSRLAMLGGA